MAYKPLSQTVTDDEVLSTPSSEAVFELSKLKANTELSNLTTGVSINQSLKFSSDDSFDIGATGGSRPKNIYLTNEIKSDSYVISPSITQNSANATGIDWSSASVQTLEVSTAVTLSFSNGSNGGAYLLKVVQGSSSGTITWPNSVKWPGGEEPTLSTASGSVDVISLVCIDDGTQNYYASSLLDLK